MADVLLINPTYRNRDANDMPHGLLAVSSVLRKTGHAVEIFDSHVHKLSPAQAVEAISDLDFHIVGISGISTSYYFWKEFVRLFRTRYNNIPIMAGGSVASTMPETFLKFIDVDAIAMGDAEPIASELTESLLLRSQLDNVPGIGFRKGEELVLRQEIRVHDMDKEVDYPPYDLIDVSNYQYHLPSDSERLLYLERYGIKSGKILEFSLFSSRGCPYSCFFCSRNFGRKFVQHSVDRFIMHMRLVADNYSPDLFCIADELMTTHREWTFDFCEKYIKSGLNIPFRINTRVDSVDMEMLSQLKKAGCYEVDFGIESGSPTILKEMNKKVTVTQNHKAIELCKEAHMFPNATIVFGMPSETKGTINETKDFLVQADIKTFGAFFATAYPKSALFDYAISEGYIQDIDKYMLSVDNASRLVINYTSMNYRRLKQQVGSVIRQVEYSWYSRRKMFFKMLKTRLRIRGISRLLIQKLLDPLRRFLSIKEKNLKNDHC